MNVESLLQHFDRLAAKPGAIPKLRRLVLDLAVRGKLVPQDPGDEPAAVLLKRIAAEKKRLVEAGEIKKPPKVADADSFVRPFEAPAGWTWCRLSDVAAYMQRGKSPKYAPGSGRLVISQKCVQWAGLDLTVAKELEPNSLEKYEPFRFLRDGDLLWNSTGTGTIGRVLVVQDLDATFVCDSHVTLVRSALASPHYIQLWLSSDHVYGRVEGDASGSTNQVELTMGWAGGVPLPLPPLAEQARIVARVDALMARLDALEAAQEAREAARARFTAASHARLSTPSETFKADAGAALSNLTPLTTRPAQVETLRQTILSLAVRGKLMEQDPADEPAEVLLERISAERAKLLNEDYPNSAEARTQLKKQQKQVIPDGLDPPPAGWVWATLLQSSLMVIDCKNKTAPYATSGIRLIRTTNVRDGRLNNIDQKFVAGETYKAWSLRARPEPGDILITREAPMGEVCRIPRGETICLGQRMMLARLVPDTVDPEFLLYSLRDPRLMDRVQDKPIGMTVQHLRVGGVETLLIPLPPLAEQRRIVEKLDRLMALCDRLERALSEAETTSAKLLDAAIRHALQPAQEAMEAAE